MSTIVPFPSPGDASEFIWIAPEPEGDFSDEARHKHNTFQATTRLRHALRNAFLDHWNRREGVDAFVVGVSGGLDSVVLAHALIRFRSDILVPVQIAHFDHGLRPDSSDDAEFVRMLADSWGVPFHHGSASVINQGLGIEAAARDSRYRFLADTAHQVTDPSGDGIPCVVVAHHADDQAETVLMHLVRGTGLNGLAGMRMVSRIHLDSRVILARPLLHVHRDLILAYAVENDLAWREDLSNFELDKDRNRIRHEVLPAMRAINPKVERSLSRMSRVIGYESTRLWGTPYAKYGEVFWKDAEPNVRLLIQMDRHEQWDWRLTRSGAIGFLRFSIATVFPDRQTPGIEVLERIVIDMSERRMGPFPIGDHLAWSVVYYSSGARGSSWALAIHDQGEPAWEPLGPWITPSTLEMLPPLIKIPGEFVISNGWTLVSQRVAAERFKSRKSYHPESVWLDAESVPRLRLTVQKQGMRIAPFGMGGKTRSVGDIFTDAKIDRGLRKQWPVIVNAETGEVVWLPWLRTSESTKITNKSRFAYVLRWKEPTHLRQHAETVTRLREQRRWIWS